MIIIERHAACWWQPQIAHVSEMIENTSSISIHHQHGMIDILLQCNRSMVRWAIQTWSLFEHYGRRLSVSNCFYTLCNCTVQEYCHEIQIGAIKLSIHLKHKQECVFLCALFGNLFKPQGCTQQYSPNARDRHGISCHADLSSPTCLAKLQHGCAAILSLLFGHRQDMGSQRFLRLQETSVGLEGSTGTWGASTDCCETIG